MEWISVKDRLPEENEEVLITNWHFNNPSTNQRFYAVAFRVGEFYFNSEYDDGADEGDFYAPDYWMPLPEPPK